MNAQRLSLINSKTECMMFHNPQKGFLLWINVNETLKKWTFYEMAHTCAKGCK